MKFSIIHPTARINLDRLLPWIDAEMSARKGCSNPAEVEYILVVHQSRRSALALPASVGCSWGRFVVVTNYGRDCLVDQCNAGAAAASGSIWIFNQDDLRWPMGWDESISRLIPDPNELVCLQAGTAGARPDLLTLPCIATRSLIRATGLNSSDYESMYADDEFSIKARQLGIVKHALLGFDHLHPSNHTAKMDDVYQLENRPEAYQQGRRTFETRRALGFPRVPFPDEIAPEVETQPFKSIAFVLPGETFRFEWLSGLLELGIAVGNEGWAIQRFLGYTSSCYSTRVNLTEDVLKSAQKPEYVFWLDDDNIVKPEQFMNLVRFLEDHPEADGIVGWCWIRQKDRWATSIGNFWPDDGVHLSPFELTTLFAGGLTPKRIEHTGFPCVLLRYDAFKEMGAAAFKPLVKSELPMLPFLTEDQIEKVPDIWFAGEDSAWCLRAKAAGLQLWVDPACKVAHLKCISQEPDIQLYQDTPKELKQWRQQVNGNALAAPKGFEQVIS